MGLLEAKKPHTLGFWLKLLRGSKLNYSGWSIFMSQDNKDKAEAAENRTQQTKGFMQHVRGGRQA